MTAPKSDVIGLDWAVGMADARRILGPGVKVQGNVDPMILFAPHERITEAVNACLAAAGPRGHILNVGHGVPQGTPEANVAHFCELARQSGEFFKSGKAAEARKQLVHA